MTMRNEKLVKANRRCLVAGTPVLILGELRFTSSPALTGKCYIDVAYFGFLEEACCVLNLEVEKQRTGPAQRGDGVRN